MANVPFYKYSNEQLCEPGPVIAKLQQAFGYLQEVQDGVPTSGSSAKYVSKDGGEWTVHISWRAAESAFIVAFTGPALEAVPKVTDAQLATVPLLAKFVPTAKVYKPFMEAFNELTHSVCKGRSMLDAAMELSGGVKPRRVVVTGFHTGGALAHIAAPILFLMAPSANLRLMTFGSPRVGNAEFAQIVYWLAQYSYRVVLPEDPVPGALLPEGPLTHSRYAIRLGASNFAADTIKQNLRQQSMTHGAPSRVTLQAEEPIMFDEYFHALEQAKLVPTAIKEPLFDKALSKVPVSTLERLLFGKPVPLRQVDCVTEVWTEEISASVTSQPQLAGRTVSVAASDYGHDEGEHLLSAFEEQLLLEGDVSVETGHAAELTSTSERPIPETPADDGKKRQAACLQRFERFASMAGSAGRQDASASSSSASDAPAATVAAPSAPDKLESMASSTTTGDLDEAEEWEDEAYGVEATHAADEDDAEMVRWYDELMTEEQLGAMLMRYKAWQAMYVSKAAYHQDPKKFARICGVDKEKCRVVADKTYDSNVWVAWHNGTLILTSRGTVTVNAIIQDLRFLSRQMPWLPYFPDARCHMGILDNVLAVTVGKADGTPSKLQQAIDAVVPPGAPINYMLITGHSLGAGVAQLLGIWAALRYPLADPRVVTFGAPRLGNHHYREAFSLLVGNSLRVVNKRDSLVRIPPSVRGQHYVHVDTILWLNDTHTVLGRGRPAKVEATAFNNFEHYLYGYLRAVSVLLPCPRGLTDFDEECPDADAKTYNQKVKQDVEAALASRKATRSKSSGKVALKDSKTMVTKAATSVATVPLHVADGAAGLVREGVITVGSGVGRGLSATVSGIASGVGLLGQGVETVGGGIMAMVGAQGPVRQKKEERALDEE